VISKTKDIFKQCISNKVVQYIASRYFVYFIQFVNSLFIALYLGPFYLGVWGFINLVLQYFLQINFGIAHSFNALISIKKNDTEYVIKAFNTSLALLFILAMGVVICFTGSYFQGNTIGEEFGFSKYIWPVCILAVMNYFIVLFSNLFRVFNKLREIAFAQSIFPILTIFCLIIGRGENLLNYLVAANCLGFLFSLFLFVLKSPIPLGLKVNRSILKSIIHKGLPLFIYNSAFYFIIISTRSVISSYYKVDEFGYFTFSYSMANIIQLLFESFSFLIFPKVINRLASKASQDAINLLDKIRNDFMTIAYLLVFIAIPLFPVFLNFFPEYKGSEYSFGLNVLTIALYTNSFGFSALLIAKNKEKPLGMIAATCLSVNIIIAWLLAIHRVEYQTIIISTIISYFLYLILVTYIGQKTILHFNGWGRLLKVSFPVSFLIPYLISAVLILLKANGMLLLIPFCVFMFMNLNRVRNIFYTLLAIIKNPNFINI